MEHIEWVHAKERPYGYTAADLAELDEDGNQYGHIGLRLGGSDGAMLYGTMRELLDWFEIAVTELRRVHGIELVRKRDAAEANIRNGLSRDDQYGEAGEGGGGSWFEDKVEIIRSLNEDSLPEAHDCNPDAPNYEYRRGMVELLMDTTAWQSDLRPEKEEVYLHIFGEEMP